MNPFHFVMSSAVGGEQSPSFRRLQLGQVGRSSDLRQLQCLLPRCTKFWISEQCVLGVVTFVAAQRARRLVRHAQSEAIFTEQTVSREELGGGFAS